MKAVVDIRWPNFPQFQSLAFPRGGRAVSAGTWAMMLAPKTNNDLRQRMRRHLPIILWRIFFAKFRWAAWMLALVLLYPFFYLLLLEIPKRSELTPVHGIYQMPYVVPTGKGNGHSTIVRTSDGELKKCNCSPATGSADCLRERHAENLSLVHSLKGEPVTVLMSSPRAYERVPLCYEIRTAQSTLVSYEQSKKRYLQDKRRAIGYLLFALVFTVGVVLYYAVLARHKE